MEDTQNKPTPVSDSPAPEAVLSASTPAPAVEPPIEAPAVPVPATENPAPIATPETPVATPVVSAPPEAPVPPAQYIAEKTKAAQAEVRKDFQGFLSLTGFSWQGITGAIIGFIGWFFWGLLLGVIAIVFGIWAHEVCHDKKGFYLSVGIGIIAMLLGIFHMIYWSQGGDMAA